MRIIKEGKIPPTSEEETICFQCGTEFAYTADDVEEVEVDPYIICPLCKKKIYV